MRNLEAFLARITLPEAQPLVDEARAFLNDPAHRRRYFILECGELYDMSDEPFEEQNQEVLEDLLDLDDEMEEALASLAPPPSAGDPLLPVRLLGLGNWSTILYDSAVDDDEDDERDSA